MSLSNLSRILPIYAALLCHGVGLYIFGDQPKEVAEGFTVTPAGIFRYGLVLLFLRLRVYPRSLQKLGRCMQFIVEFLLSMYILEYLQEVFWLPLEMGIQAFLVKLSEGCNQIGNSLEMDPLIDFCQYLGEKWMGYIMAYVMSLFFLICVLYGTRLLDFRERQFVPDLLFYVIITEIKTLLVLLRLRKPEEQSKNHHASGRRKGIKDHDSDHDDDDDYYERESMDECKKSNGNQKAKSRKKEGVRRNKVARRGKGGSLIGAIVAFYRKILDKLFRRKPARNVCA